MAIKTTRIKTVQAPRMVTFDLSSQLDGVTQTFTLPERVTSQDTHYLLWNGQVYRNHAGDTFYDVIDNGMKIVTKFDEAPRSGANYVLQFVKSDNSDGSDAISDELEALKSRVTALEERINNV